MKIAVVSSFVPFVKGGARNIVDWLVDELRDAGHSVEAVWLPFTDHPDLLLEQHAAYRWVELEEADLVICLRPPSHVIRHPNKVIWFIHHIRYFYDLWDTPYREMPDTLQYQSLRQSLHSIDTAALKEAKHVFTNSQTVSDRLTKYNAIDSEVLYPPLAHPERFGVKSYGDEIVYISRLEPHKRQHLAIQAMRHTKTSVKLRIAGTGQDPHYIHELRTMVVRYGLEDRVSIEVGWISDERKIELLSNALAVCYIPFDEDSYGYPTLEAAHSSKAVVTTSDSGGVNEFVQHELNGMIAKPTGASLGVAFDRLHSDTAFAQKLGENSLARIDTLGISWDRVLERLLS